MISRFRQGQGIAGIVTFFLVLFCFSIVWVFGLASWISTVGQLAITTQNLTGIEAFVAANLNLVILLCIILSSLVVVYFGART